MDPLQLSWEDYKHIKYTPVDQTVLMGKPHSSVQPNPIQLDMHLAASAWAL